LANSSARPARVASIVAKLGRHRDNQAHTIVWGRRQTPASQQLWYHVEALAIWLMDWRSGAGLSAALIGYERQREWLEGLAKYVELEILRQAFVTADYQPVPALGDDPEFEGYGGFESRWAREVDQIRRMAGDEGDGRFYYSGFAQAALLDRFMPGWKSEAMAEGVFLEELLQGAVGLRPNEPVGLLCRPGFVPRGLRSGDEDRAVRSPAKAA
jgi:hypothetical protein